MGGIAQQGGSAKVHHQSTIVMEEHRAALELGTFRSKLAIVVVDYAVPSDPSRRSRPVKSSDLLGKWPIGTGENTDQVWSISGEHVVNRIRGCDDATTCRGSSAAGEPAHHVSGFFGVKRLAQASATVSPAP